MNRIIFISVIFLFAAISLAQSSSIYIPRNIVKAYEKGTRSYDGKPGPNYWINHSDYKIQAEVFPKERIVKGTEQIKYYNDSPDTLRRIVLRLYQDIMKKGNSRDDRISPNDETDGVAIDTFMINGAGINTKEKSSLFRTATNIIVRSLEKPIPPKSITTIDVKWSVIIPKETRIRMGAYNDSTLYVAYWYPQISVYDDIDGWDLQEYGGSVEFYNDKNNFDFEITEPNKFLVWATGLYQNLQEVVLWISCCIEFILYCGSTHERYQSNSHLYVHPKCGRSLRGLRSCLYFDCNNPGEKQRRLRPRLADAGPARSARR